MIYYIHSQGNKERQKRKNKKVLDKVKIRYYNKGTKKKEKEKQNEHYQGKKNVTGSAGNFNGLYRNNGT